jgi:hypothetical protein
MQNEFPAHNEVMGLLYGTPARNYLPDIISILSNIEGLDEDTLPLLVRLLTTGSQNAREDVRKAFVATAASFQTAFDEAEHTHGQGDWNEYEDRWDRFLDGYERPFIRNRLLEVWNAANVIDETGSNVIIRDIISGMDKLAILLKSVNPDCDDAASTDRYWRGLAAIAVSRDGLPHLTEKGWVKLDVAVPGFIEWAGNHEDIATVIDVARERDSFDRGLLEGILVEQGDKTALSSGVL